MHYERQKTHRRGYSLLSGAAFYVLIGLLVVTLLISLLLSQSLEDLHLHLAIPIPSQHQHATLLDKEEAKPHLHPRLPHLPPFPSIENEHLLINRTLYENQPTIAGIAAVLYRHINALHESNRRISKTLTSTPKRGGQKKREEEADVVRGAYFRLVDQNLREFEDAYRGRPIFEVRDDDSVFISIASYREHLLGETLMSAFGQAAQ